MKKTLMLSVSFLLMLQVLFLAAPTPGYACSCVAPTSPQAALAEAKAVFAGKVQQVEAQSPYYKVTFAVNTAWKGIDNAESAVLTAIGGEASCGIKFQPGQEYLIYSNTTEDGRLHASLCSRTKELQQADEDLKALGTGTHFLATSFVEQRVERSEPAKQQAMPFEPEKQNAVIDFGATGVWAALAVLLAAGAAFWMLQRKRGK
ncbi:tissue inhibitor of metalloproteinase [Tumebacillus sp. BK434]|uniref:hypothetical protein n=1 Tax=Tumebacillus sp. BK434 TaxID=2512169 RepID=UPI0010EFEADE|nr:hypothetical protein [Tumebacillus sp. BK434]TCP55484.1 tissue inhibitor of metalloproteinase [Tumebacillus sp. BK434]